jgi:hypothetical protein
VRENQKEKVKNPSQDSKSQANPTSNATGSWISECPEHSAISNATGN